MNRNRKVALAAVCLLALAGCCSNASADRAELTPVPGFVTDVGAFDAFVATKPTPGQFKARYPDVLLVLPGQIATKEMRLNRSRYFAELDADGRITGGKFQ